MSIVAFTPRMLHPHVRLSCGSTDGTGFSGPQRFTDIRRAPGSQSRLRGKWRSLPQNLKLISDDQNVKPAFEFQTYDFFRAAVSETTQIASISLGKSRPALSKLYPCNLPCTRNKCSRAVVVKL